MKNKQAIKRLGIKSQAHFFLLNKLALLRPKNSVTSPNPADRNVAATLFSNLAYYGFVPSAELSNAILCASFDELKLFWDELQPALSDVSGESRKMSDAVVYKNFPREVLEMSQGEYWYKQIWMYLGCPPSWFNEIEVERETVSDSLSKMKVLHLATEKSAERIYANLLCQQSLWIPEQKEQVFFCIERMDCKISLEIPFKENMVAVAKYALDKDITDISMRSATDVLRLAVALCEGDISLKENTKFKFSRKVRRFLLSMLEKCSLEEDFAARKEVWKRLLRCLHPFDYNGRFKNVERFCDILMLNAVQSFNSKVDEQVRQLDFSALDICAKRPGVYMRNLVSFYSTYGRPAIEVFVSTVLSKLTNLQLLKIQSVFENINVRKFRTFPPKGTWKKMQVVADNRPPIVEADREFILGSIGKELKSRIHEKYGEVFVDPKLNLIKVKGNDTDLSPYGRGTVFPIPRDINFIRTASYWEADRCIWFDNGVNFFDSNWIANGTVCWTNPKAHKNGAVFSGDPVITHTKRCACQMIDLYPQKLRDAGVRYAVWNILCYSRVPFKDAGDVFAAFQWGENAQTGKLFEPSRCQLSFPVGGNCYAKYIVCIDLEKMEVIYLDAPLHANVQSAERNESSLTRNMPAFMEYVESLPTLYDLFKHADSTVGGMPVLYSDSDTKIDSSAAYVFKLENKDNVFENIGIDKLIE